LIEKETRKSAGLLALFVFGDVMMRKYFGAVLMGLAGGAILVSLGVWQLQRHIWKAGVLARIDAKITSAAVALPPAPTEARDQFLPVRIAGEITGPEINILASVKKIGPGYRIISVFVTDDGRRILLDRGFVAITAKDAPRPPTRAVIIGNLHWPDEKGSAIPDPDIGKNIWFARDIPAMAAHLKTEPVLVVQRESDGVAPVTTPFPVDSSSIPNRHLEYVVTWWSLALAWIGMSAYLILRIRRKIE
jgi:surfeit locus 1 family protein